MGQPPHECSGGADSSGCGAPESPSHAVRYAAATAGSWRKLMKAWARTTSRASAGMTRSSQEMIVPSSGTKKRTSGFSRRT